MQAVIEPEVGRVTRDHRWLVAKRISFRFVALYFVIYFFPAPLTTPFRSPEQMEWYGWLSAKFWTPVVGTVGHALGVRGSLRFGRTNDGLADYVQLVCFAVVAAAAAALWSALDPGRSDARTRAFLRAWLRYVLAGMVLAYGFAKVFPSQMPLPEPSLLLTPYGQSAPMKLLWTFMGASPAYEVFCGIAETLGALLLFSRRTTPLGALLVAAVMSNVVMLNLCFGVYLKQLAIHLFLLALFLLAPSVPRLFRALVLGQSVPATRIEEPFARFPRRGYLGVKAVVIGCILYSQAAMPAHHYFVDSDGAPLPDLYGIYDVEEMRRGGDIVPALLTNPTYWQRVYFGRRESGAQLADGSRSTFVVSRSAAKETWFLSKGDGATLSVVRTDDGRLVIEGTLDGSKVLIRARPTDKKNLRLVQSQFRWVTEF